MRKKSHMPGLRKRQGIWHIDKAVKGYGRIQESTGTGDYKEAEKILIEKLNKINQQRFFGKRPERTFREAGTKYLEENGHLSNIATHASILRQLDPFIGDLPLNLIHDGTLRPYIDWKQKRPVDPRFLKRIAAINREQQERRAQVPACQGYYQLEQAEAVKNKSINNALQVVRRILNLAARAWRDDKTGLTWLEAAPLISLLPPNDARPPYALSWKEQQLLFAELPPHLERMAVFKVNTGTREAEVCALRWEWEVAVPELGTSVFLIPQEFVKNREERLVVLNEAAQAVIEQCRGKHPLYVFAYYNPRTKAHSRIERMNNSAWDNARLRAAIKLYQEQGFVIPPELLQPASGQDQESRQREAERKKNLQSFMVAHMSGFADVHVHDLKHTFGRRLQAAGVDFSRRKVLLGHLIDNITDFYSMTEIDLLIQEANRACTHQGESAPTVRTIIQRRAAALGLRQNPGNSAER